ncbi:Sodium/hydrogen exchanger [Novosphingobium resinovorum]|uniref:Sodium/hydrogen exchanger n=1 Tax=Novosphingobium resinovorum TaxID=158500 RepID=A0A031JK46_9SPHN|nr:Sodium/hydrogen exchanger [Novosphingobium resinovorum]
MLVNNWHRSVRIIREAKRLNPAIHVIASLRDDAHLGELAQAGAAHVFPENYAAGLGLGAQALMTLGMSADDATDRIRAMRAQLSPDLQIVPR